MLRCVTEERDLSELLFAGRVRGQIQRHVERSQILRAVSRQFVERTALDQRLKDAPVHLFCIDALGKIEEIGELSVGLARLDDAAHRAFADALDRRKTEANAIPDHRKVDQRLVDVGRQHRDAHLLGFVDVLDQLIGLVFDRGHQRRQVLQRMIGFEIRGLIG